MISVFRMFLLILFMIVSVAEGDTSTEGEAIRTLSILLEELEALSSKKELSDRDLVSRHTA